MRKYREAYESQRSGARRRGIEWQFTYESWLAWWGDDLARRGTGKYDLQMQRVADSGPYHPDNVRKGIPKQNRETQARMYHHRESREARAAILAAEMEKPSISTVWEYEELTDEVYASRRFGLPRAYRVYGV